METLTPDLFHLDYGRLLEVLVTIVVFSFIIERILSVLFESQLFIDWAEAKEPVTINKVDPNGNETQDEIPGHDKKKGVREIIAIIASVMFCLFYQLDAFSIILQSSNKMTKIGMVLTGLVIAGGSKASMKLFKDVMDVMSNAERMRQEKINK